MGRATQDELLQQVERFAPILDISPNAFVVTDPDVRVVAWNPAAERLFGYTADEAIGRNLDDLVASTEELHPEAVAIGERTMERDRVQAIARRTRKDGSFVDVELLAAPLVVDGQVVGMLGSYHDITELNGQRRLFEAMLEVSPEAIALIALDDTVTSWNPAAERLFGYTSEEAVGRDINELVANRDDLFTEGVAIDRGADRGETAHVLTQRVRKDGSLVDVDILGGPLTVGGEIVAKHAFYHDVTELQEQKRYFQSLLDLSPAAIAVTDLESKVVSWSPGAVKLFGYPAEEAIGSHLDDLVATRADLREEALSYSERAARGERLQATGIRTRKDGSLVDVQMFSEPVVVNEKRIGYVVIYHDITDVQQQRRYFESLLEISPTAIVVTDLDGKVVSWNPAAERLFGYGADEAIDAPLDDLVATAPELHREAEEVTDGAVRGERSQITARRTRKDGTLVDVQMVSAAVVVGEERVGLLWIYHDITEVQQQKRWFESVLTLSPTAIVTVDDRSTITSWNPAAERLFGYPADEAIGSHIDDLVANRPEILAEASRYSAAEIGGEEVRVITRRTRKDGSLIDVEMLVAPVLIGGERVGHSVIYHDIGEIQRQRRYYEALVQANPVAIVLMDPEGTVTSWNPAAERLFGYTAEESVGRHIDDLVATDPEVRAEALNASEVGIGGELVHMITKRTRKDGALVDVELFGAPVVVGDEAVGLYGLYHDVGELQRARVEAEAATEAKSAFLATMSHEIRTPLNAVIGMTGLLLDTELSSEQRQFAEVIRGSGDALLGVINDILDFSKIEAGRLELERAPFDLRECVESALELVAATAAAKGLDLAYDLAPDAPRGVVGDLTRVRQVLINLLNNAVKFTQEGEVVLTVSSEPGRASGRHRITFSVRDTGIGIPQDRMDQLFESFSQVDTSTTRRYGGTGLGLAISRRLVELMDGSMWAESAVGEGSTFWFATEMEAAELPSRPFELANAPELGGKQVLVVDDNATNRQILSRQMSSWGMQVRETGSPEEALGWVRGDGRFDMAIVDMQMPEMDGVMLASEIRRVRGDLPLVLLSSLGGAADVPVETFAASLTKPVRPSQLFEALLDVVGAGIDGAASPDVGDMGPEVAARHPLRILLVEDNAVNQQLALLLLQKLGYRADVAANGVEALEALERQTYDAVLMDVEMPEMDGLEATQRIRERSSEGPHVIAVTANALQGERERCLAAGMNDYITKPLRIEDLAAALGRSPRADEDGPASVVDVEVLRRLAAPLGEGGGEAVRGLIETFRSHAPDLIGALRRGVENGDAESVRVAAHTLKSNAAMFGASALAELTRQVEASASEGALEDGARFVDGIASELERVMGELERLGPELEP